MDPDQKENLAELSKALGHPHRIKILHILANLPCDSQCMVGNIVDRLPISQSTVSQHLKILKNAGWIKGNIDGPKVCYCLEEDIVEDYRGIFNSIFTDEE